MSDRAVNSLRPQGLLGFLRIYFRPILVLLVTVPVTGYAVIHSVVWIDTPFPGFFLLNNLLANSAVISTVSGYDWPPDKASLFLSQVVAVDGKPVRSSGDVYRHVAGLPVGTPITYTLRRDGTEFQRTVASMSFTTVDYVQTCGILLLFGFISLAVALVVGFLQPRTTQARVFLISGFAAGLYPITGTLLYQPDTPTLISKMNLLSESLFPATWIHLALVFPIAHRFAGARRLLLAAPYLVSAALVVMMTESYYRHPQTLYALPATWVYTVFAILFFDGAMAFAYWKNRDPLARARIKATQPGLVLATLLPLIAFANNASANRDFPLQFGLVLAPIFYASIAYSIAKHDLFDIDRLVRQSFVYGFLTLIIAGTYTIALLVTARLVPTLGATDQAVLNAGFVLVLVLVLDPLRRGVQNVVDRAFFRRRLDYRATIRNLSELMTTLLDLREVVEQVTRVVMGAMQLESITVLTLGPDAGPVTQWSRLTDGELSQQAADPILAKLAKGLEELPAEFRSAKIPEFFTDTEVRENVRTFLESIGASIVLPLIFRGHAVGALALGAKRSGQPFSPDDVDLLRTLANQTAIAVQNARSYQALQDLTHTLDEKVQQQTRALRASNQQLTQAYDDLKNAQAQLVQSEKMASLGQLVAGVAHELNNPASFVHGGLANLETYLDGFMEVIRAYEHVPIVDPATARSVAETRARVHLDYLLRETPGLLRICHEGSERTKKIVDDLRTFARADQGERVLTNLTEGIDSTVRLLGDRINRARITVRKEYANVPRVEVNAGQLNQVWMNLIGNAVDAVEGQPTPEIYVALRLCSASEGAATVLASPADDGDGTTPWVEVEIKDNGSGIKPEDMPKIFEPFFTTKPIGRGTGLGLSIVYGAVKSHGGIIAVKSEPRRGTAVTVRLPAASHSTTPAARDLRS